MSEVTTILHNEEEINVDCFTLGTESHMQSYNEQSVSLPIVRAVGARDGGVGLIWNQPVEALVSEEANLLPLAARHIAASCVKVTQQHDVLLFGFKDSATHFWKLTL